MIKVAGIICDKYKVDKFKEVLTRHGFEQFEVTELNSREGHKIIRVTHDSKDSVELTNIITQTERAFKRKLHNKKK